MCDDIIYADQKNKKQKVIFNLRCVIKHIITCIDLIIIRVLGLYYKVFFIRF